MISIEMSPCQFAKVNEIITNDHKEATMNITSETTGHVHTSQIDADYEYRERPNNLGTLVFLNEVKHGMYKMVSDDTIGAHLSKLLSSIECDEAAPETISEPEGTAPPLPSSTEVNSFVKTPVQSGASS